MNSSVLENRQEHVSALLAHCVVFFSGKGHDGKLHSLRSLCLYNPYTDRCQKYEINGDMEVPRNTSYACAVNIGKDIFMFGGWEPFSETGTVFLNDLWKLSFDEDSEELHIVKWEEMKVEPASATPSPRCGHCGWEYNELLWTFGGFEPITSVLTREGRTFLHEYGEYRTHGRGQTNNQLFSVNPSIKQWINHESRGATPCPRVGAAAAVLVGSVWLYGGHDDLDDTESLNDLYQLEMDRLTWTQIQMLDTDPPRLLSHTLNPLSEQSLLLCGGPRVMALKALEPGIVQLSNLTTPNRLHRRMEHTATTIKENNLVIFGGHTLNEHGIPTNDLFVLFSNHMTLLQLATRMLYKHLDTFALKDIPVLIRKLLRFPVTAQGEFVDKDENQEDYAVDEDRLEPKTL